MAKKKQSQKKLAKKKVAKKKVAKKVPKKTTKKLVAKKKVSKKKTTKKKIAKKINKKVLKKKVNKKKSAKVAPKKVAKKPAKKATKKASSKKVLASKKKATKKKNNQIPLEMDDWPMDREVVFNPERIKYLKREKTDSCVFCAAANFGPAFESLSLYKDQNVQVVVNKYPYYTGHIMVMPVRHVGNLEDLGESEYLDIMKMLRKAVSVVKEVYSCAGVNAGINLGRAAGAGIPDHLHWHILPRWSGDTNFFPAIANARVISEGLEDTYNKLAPHFGQQGSQLSLPGSISEKQVEFKLED